MKTRCNSRMLVATLTQQGVNKNQHKYKRHNTILHLFTILLHIF
jgi:hypothetical protein